jgi:hypothetical protein
MVVICLAFSVALSGCASLFQRTLPKDWEPDRSPRCDPSSALGVLDVLQTVGYTATGVIAGAAAGLDADVDHLGALFAGSLLMAVFHGASAHHGFQEAGRCRDAMDLRAAGVARTPPQRQRDTQPVSFEPPQP